MENIKRIHLLSSTEIEELYARPEFNEHEQNLYFFLSPAERAALEQFRNIQTRIHFILQLGYFKAKQPFFNLSLDEVSLLMIWHSEKRSEVPKTARKPIISAKNAVYQKMLVNGVSQEIIDEFTRISPIAWTHTLFTGQYNFKRNNGKIDVEAMARILESHLKQHFWRDDWSGFSFKVYRSGSSSTEPLLGAVIRERIKLINNVSIIISKGSGGRYPFDVKDGRSVQTAPMQTVENSYALLPADRQTSTANAILW
ncbi:DUF4158 domain-containing protein [Photorhabdus khanii]|uniref:DUF4158 domain-containing protein n=1 Tax=Photorhabdus khanii subsp. guanajuatensis TaxID=2100166 RepID=A0A4R4JZF9_9GAMM|nr:DUF4158 domain-containing protein [Photorhabdus khanii]TDB60278.1 hypothetical protein C5467_06985 [Photorhabdus khanii subsp. guanajuatensis]